MCRGYVDLLIAYYICRGFVDLLITYYICRGFMDLSLSRLFADDTSLGYSSQNVVEIENVINHDLCELNTWSTKWLMSFNPDKTEIMLFSNTDVRYNFNFTFNGNNIPITMSHKHLGITLSCDAKWNNHIENIILSVSRHLGVLRKLKYRLSRQNLEKL